MMAEAWTFFESFFNLLVSNNWKLYKSDDKLQMLLRTIHSHVKSEISKYNKSSASLKFEFKCDPNKVEVCRKNLHKMIELLEETTEKRETFLRHFPHFKKCRKGNIDQLDKVAKALHDERKIINSLKIIGSVVGVAGAAAIVTSIFFPPAGVAALPAWLGGSALAAYLPSFLRKPAVAVTSALAVRGAAATAVSSVSHISTAVAEVVLLKKHMDEAKDILAEDKKHFHIMEKWFAHTKSFINAMNDVLDFNVTEFIFNDFKDFFDNIQKLLNSKQYKEVSDKFGIFFNRIFHKLNFNQVFPPDFLVSIIGVLLVIFLIHRRNRILFGCIVTTAHLVTTVRVADSGMKAASAATAIGTKGGMAGIARAPKVLARDVTLGAFAGIGIALDLASIVLNSIDISKGSQSEAGKRVEEASRNLKEELEVFEEVYKELQNSVMHSLFWSAQGSLTTGMSYSGTS